MIVKCPFCRTEHHHNEEMVEKFPDTIYTCLIEGCGLRYVIRHNEIDEFPGYHITTMNTIYRYTTDGNPIPSQIHIVGDSK